MSILESGSDRMSQFPDLKNYSTSEESFSLKGYEHLNEKNKLKEHVYSSDENLLNQHEYSNDVNSLKEYGYSNEIIHKRPYENVTIGTEEIECIDGVTIVCFESELDMLEYTKLESEYHTSLIKNKIKKRYSNKNKSKRFGNFNDSIIPTKTKDITKIKGWKSKVFSSKISGYGIESEEDTKTRQKKDFCMEISDSSDDVEFVNEKVLWSNNFYSENSNSFDKLSLREENSNWNFDFEDLESEHFRGFDDAEIRQDSTENFIVRKENNFFDSDLSSTFSEHSPLKKETIYVRKNLKTGTIETEVSKEEDVYSSESEGEELIDASNNSYREDVSKRKMDPLIISSESSSWPLELNTFKRDVEDELDGEECAKALKDTFEIDVSSENENSCSSDFFTSFESEGEEGPKINKKTSQNEVCGESENSCSSDISSLFEMYSPGESTSSKLINLMGTLDPTMGIQLNDSPFIKILEGNKSFNVVLNNVFSELCLNDPFFTNYRSYMNEKLNKFEGLFESPVLECYLKNFSKVIDNDEIDEIPKYTRETAREYVKNMPVSNRKPTVTKNQPEIQSTDTSYDSESNFKIKKDSIPRGYLWVFGKPIMISNKRLIPRKKTVNQITTNMPSTVPDIPNKVSPDSNIAKKLCEEGSLSDSSCELIEEYIDITVSDKEEKEMNLRNNPGKKFMKKLITNMKDMRIAFFRKYKTNYPFFLECKSSTDEHTACSSYKVLSLGMILTIGKGRPFARKVSENVESLKLNETLIDSRWAHIAASAVLDPRNKEANYVEKRLLVPVTEKVINSLISREKWYMDVPIPTRKYSSLGNVSVWCTSHSCYGCRCSTPVINMKNNMLVWKSPYDGYCLNEKELSDIPLKREPSEEVNLYNRERYCARSAGLLFNYSARNRNPIYQTSLIKFMNKNASMPHSYIRLKYNVKSQMEEETLGEDIDKIIISDDDEDVVEIVSETDDCQIVDQNKPVKQFDIKNIKTKADLRKTLTRKYSIGPAHFERKGILRNLMCTNNTFRKPLQKVLTVNSLNEKDVKTESPLNKQNEQKELEVPDFGLLCTTTELGYLSVAEFNKDFISVEDPLNSTLYHGFANLDWANVWLNRCFKKHIRFESPDIDLRWIIAKKGILQVSKHFDKNMFNDKTLMINKDRHIVKLKLTHEVVNNIKSFNLEESPDKKKLKRESDPLFIPQNQLKKVRISDIMKQIETGKDKTNNENFQKIDSLFNVQSSDNMSKSLIYSYDTLGTARSILSNKSNLKSFSEYLQRSSDESEDPEETMDDSKLKDPLSMSKSEESNGRTISLSRAQLEKLSILKKHFPILVPSNTKVMVQNQKSDCVLINSNSIKTLPLNIKSTPAKSILKYNFK